VKNITDKVDRLMSLGLKWNGEVYYKDDINYKQSDLFNDSDKEFEVKLKLIKKKLNIK
jgi:hypothetical protein